MLDLNRGCDTPALLSSGLRWASVWSTCPRSRSRMSRRIWTSSMTVWSSTTPVTVAQRWRIQIASSAHPNQNSGLTHTHTHRQHHHHHYHHHAPDISLSVCMFLFMLRFCGHTYHCVSTVGSSSGAPADDRVNVFIMHGRIALWEKNTIAQLDQ